MFKLLTSRSKLSKKGLIPEPPQKQSNSNQTQYYDENQGYNRPNHNVNQGVTRGQQQPTPYKGNHNKPLPQHPSSSGQQDPSPNPLRAQSHIQSRPSYNNMKHNPSQYQGSSTPYHQPPGPPHPQTRSNYSGQPPTIPYSQIQTRVPPLRSNNLQYTQFSPSSGAPAKLVQHNASFQEPPLHKFLTPLTEAEPNPHFYQDQPPFTGYRDPISPSHHRPVPASPLRGGNYNEAALRRPASSFQVRNQSLAEVDEEPGQGSVYRGKNISVPDDLGSRYRRDALPVNPDSVQNHDHANSLYSPQSHDSYQNTVRDFQWEDFSAPPNATRELRQNHAYYNAQNQTRDVCVGQQDIHYGFSTNGQQPNQTNASHYNQGFVSDSTKYSIPLHAPQKTQGIAREYSAPASYSDESTFKNNATPLYRISQKPKDLPALPTQRTHSNSDIESSNSNLVTQEKNSEYQDRSTLESSNQEFTDGLDNTKMGQPMRLTRSTPSDLARAPPKWKFLEELRKGHADSDESLSSQPQTCYLNSTIQEDESGCEANDNEKSNDGVKSTRDCTVTEVSPNAEYEDPDELLEEKDASFPSLKRFHKAAELQKLQRYSIKAKSPSTISSSNSAQSDPHGSTLHTRSPSLNHDESMNRKIPIQSLKPSAPMEVDHQTYFQTDPQLRNFLSKEVARDKSQGEVPIEEKNQEKDTDKFNNAKSNDILGSSSRTNYDHGPSKTTSGILYQNTTKVSSQRQSPNSVAMADVSSPRLTADGDEDSTDLRQLKSTSPVSKKLERQGSKTKFLSNKFWNKPSTEEGKPTLPTISSSTPEQVNPQVDRKGKFNNERKSLRRLGRRSHHSASKSNVELSSNKEQPKTVVQNLRNKFEMKIQEASGSGSTPKPSTNLLKQKSNTNQHKVTQSTGNLRLHNHDANVRLGDKNDLSSIPPLPTKSNNTDSTTKLALGWKASALSRNNLEVKTSPFPDSIKQALLKSPTVVSPKSPQRSSSVWSFNVMPKSRSSLQPPPAESNEETLSQPQAMAFQLELSEARLQIEMWRKKLREEQILKSNLEKESQDRISRLTEMHSTETNNIKELCSRRIRELIYVIRELQTLNTLYRTKMNQHGVAIPSTEVDVETLMREPSVEPVFSFPLKSETDSESSQTEFKQVLRKSATVSRLETVNENKDSDSSDTSSITKSPASSAPAGSLTPLTMYQFIEDQYRQIVKDDEDSPIALKLAKSASSPPDPVESKMPSLSSDQKFSSYRGHNDTRISQLLSSIERTATAIVEMDATRHVRSGSTSQSSQASSVSKSSSFYANSLAYRSQPNFLANAEGQLPKSSQTTDFRKHYASTNDLHHGIQKFDQNDLNPDQSKEADGSMSSNFKSHLAPSLSSLNLALAQPSHPSKHIHSAKDYPIDLSGIDASLKTAPVETIPESLPSFVKPTHHSQILPRPQKGLPRLPTDTNKPHPTPMEPPTRFPRGLAKPLPSRPSVI